MAASDQWSVAVRATGRKDDLCTIHGKVKREWDHGCRSASDCRRNHSDVCLHGGRVSWRQRVPVRCALYATISVFFVPCCPVLSSFYLVSSYMFELNKWRWRCRHVLLATNSLRPKLCEWVSEQRYKSQSITDAILGTWLSGIHGRCKMHLTSLCNSVTVISTFNNNNNSLGNIIYRGSKKIIIITNSVERGICPIAKSTMTELFLWPNALHMHETAIFPLPV